jgi:hypothetical protein
MEAGERINMLLGIWSLVTWGHAGCGWWSHMTHEGGGCVIEEFKEEELRRSIAALKTFPKEVRNHIEAALYWVRSPRGTFAEWHKSDALRVYAGYWNAFECLVEAVNLLRPQPKPSKSQKQEQIDKFFLDRAGTINAASIQQCYLEIVNPGLVGKASHALRVCVPEHSERYILECFRRPDRAERLYDIRNAINHGDIDAENPLEIARVNSRRGQLWMIVWRMFASMIPFSAPADTKME